MDFKLVRTKTAGVFAGLLESYSGQEVILQNARRIYYWEGAASLSELAMVGTTKPKKCKFPIPVTRVILTDAVEIMDVTPEAQASIEAVPVWSAKNDKVEQPTMNIAGFTKA